MSVTLARTSATRPQRLTRPGRSVRRLLPPSFHLAVPSNLPKQIRPHHRRGLLIPVRSSHNPCQTIPNIDCRWLTSFIFAAEAYDANNCFLDAPPGITCGRKRANEAFIFLALYVPPTITADPPYLSMVQLTNTVSSLSSACSSKAPVSGPTARNTPRPRRTRRTVLAVLRSMAPLSLPRLREPSKSPSMYMDEPVSGLCCLSIHFAVAI